MKAGTLFAVILSIALMVGVGSEVLSQVPRESLLRAAPPDPAGSLYYSINPMEIYGGTVSSEFLQGHGYFGPSLYVRHPKNYIFYGPVHLPHGATIRSWRAWVYDRSSEAGFSRVGLSRRGESGIEENIGTPNSTTVPFIQTNIKILRRDYLNHPVNNRDYSYYFYVNFDIRVPTHEIKFIRAVIVYTMP